MLYNYFYWQHHLILTLFHVVFKRMGDVSLSAKFNSLRLIVNIAFPSLSTFIPNRKLFKIKTIFQCKKILSSIEVIGNKTFTKLYIDVPKVIYFYTKHIMPL